MGRSTKCAREGCLGKVTSSGYCQPHNNESVRARRYGLTINELQKLLEKTHCDCCGKKHKKRKAIDHCHETGIIRGLLCYNCNVGIGKLGDNIEGLLNAIKYLSK